MSSKNIQSTQKLLEAAKGKPLSRFVYASSSSVYGLTPTLPMTEKSPSLPAFSLTESPSWPPSSSASFISRITPSRRLALRFFTASVRASGGQAFHKSSSPSPKAGRSSLRKMASRLGTSPLSRISWRLLAASRLGAGGVYNVGGGHREKMNRPSAVLGRHAGKTSKSGGKTDRRGIVPILMRYSRKPRTELGFQPPTVLREGSGRNGIGSAPSMDSGWVEPRTEVKP